MVDVSIQGKTGKSIIQLVFVIAYASWSISAALAVDTHAQPIASIIDIYQQALANDPSLKAALSRNQAAQEQINQGKALYRPEVSINAAVASTHNDVSFVGQSPFPSQGGVNFQGYQYGLNARQPIFRKQNLIAIEQSKTQVQLADKQLRLTQQQLILNVVQAYFQTLIAQDNIDLLSAQKAAVKRQLDSAQANFDVGNANITDVNEAKARFDLIVAQEIAAQNAHQVARYRIEALTQQPPAALATLKADAQMHAQIQALAYWQDLALKDNLNIQIQQEGVTLAEQNHQKNAAGHLPTLDVVASYTKSYENGGNFGFGVDLDSTVIGLQLQMPLYAGGAINSRTREALLNQQAAQDDLSVVKTNITLATQTAYLNLQSSLAQISAFEQALNSTQSQLESTQLGYEIGVRTSVDLLNAQQLMFAAKRDLLRARYQYLIDMVQLKTVTGQVTEADLIEINQELMH